MIEAAPMKVENHRDLFGRDFSAHSLPAPTHQRCSLTFAFDSRLGSILNGKTPPECASSAARASPGEIDMWPTLPLAILANKARWASERIGMNFKTASSSCGATFSA